MYLLLLHRGTPFLLVVRITFILLVSGSDSSIVEILEEYSLSFFVIVHARRGGVGAASSRRL